MLKLFLWLRYLHKKKLVLLSIAAVALSVALLIVVASLFNGFINAVEKTGREVFGDIYFNPYVRVPKSDLFLKRLESMPQVQAATAVFETFGLLQLGPGDVRPVRVLGIEPDKYAKVTDFKNCLLKQKDASTQPSFINDSQDKTVGFVGIGVLEKPDEQKDEYDFQHVKSWFNKDVVLTIGAVVIKEADPGTGTTKRDFKQRYLKFNVADIVFTGVYLRDSRNVYLPIEKVRQLTGANESEQKGPHEVIQIRLAPEVDPKCTIEPIRKAWQDFATEHNLPEYCRTDPLIKTSEQMQDYFVSELRKQMAILMLIFGIICSVGILLIFCIFYMIVITRQKDIAIIKSCGANNRAVAMVFIGFGACVGIIGSALGTILGTIVIKNINAIEKWVTTVSGLKLWKSSIYFFERIPNQLDIYATCWIISFAALAAITGALIPAIVAARTRPVKILRYE